MDADIIIVGGGPVGLLLGNLLGQAGIRTVIFEQRSEPEGYSKAIGITPPSLGILRKIGIEKDFIDSGVTVRQAHVYGHAGKIGSLTFDRLKGDFPFILSLPQTDTERKLEAHLQHYPCVQLHRRHEVTAVTQAGGGHAGVTVVHQDVPKDYTARFVCACDGVKSRMRQMAGIPFIGRSYPDTFLMGDFIDRTGFEDDVYLFFTRNGSVESFPLPAGKRRWIVQTPGYMPSPDSGLLQDLVGQRSGISLEGRDKVAESPFRVQNYMNRDLYLGRLVFCGDAAHVMSPIGGQGMNAGFADAELLAYILKRLVARNAYDDRVLKKYAAYRTRSTRSAATRAWLSMRIGTQTGQWGPRWRDALIWLLLNTPVRNAVPPFYAMRTLPYGTLEKVLAKGSLFPEEDQFHEAQ